MNVNTPQMGPAFAPLVQSALAAKSVDLKPLHGQLLKIVEEKNFDLCYPEKLSFEVLMKQIEKFDLRKEVKHFVLAIIDQAISIQESDEIDFEVDLELLKQEFSIKTLLSSFLIVNNPKDLGDLSKEYGGRAKNLYNSFVELCRKLLQAGPSQNLHVFSPFWKGFFHHYVDYKRNWDEMKDSIEQKRFDDASKIREVLQCLQKGFEGGKSPILGSAVRVLGELSGAVNSSSQISKSAQAGGDADLTEDPPFLKI